jgi:hypothetical protein
MLEKMAVLHGLSAVVRGCVPVVVSVAHMVLLVLLVAPAVVHVGQAHMLAEELEERILVVAMEEAAEEEPGDQFQPVAPERVIFPLEPAVVVPPARLVLLPEVVMQALPEVPLRALLV